MQRRSFIKTGLTLAGAFGSFPVLAVNSTTAPARQRDILMRPIPSSGEPIPAIGMGTWRTFNVGNNEELRLSRCSVQERFFQLGGTLIDSSPMYGSSEEVVGYCAQRTGVPDNYFPATKVWTSSMREAESQVEDSFRLWQVDRFALFQVHNLVGWQELLPQLQAMKAAGKIRYTGITTSHGRRHRELEKIMSSEEIDFVQLTYNLEDREAENQLLPLARERGIAVLVNRPFRRGALFGQLTGQPLPGWAADIGCSNHAQIFLKFIISHPAVTCAIPATTQVVHMEQNMAAMTGVMPDAEMRRQMIRWFEEV